MQWPLCCTQFLRLAHFSGSRFERRGWVFGAVQRVPRLRHLCVVSGIEQMLVQMAAACPFAPPSNRPDLPAFVFPSAVVRGLGVPLLTPASDARFRLDGVWGSPETIHVEAGRVSGCRLGANPTTGAPFVPGCGTNPASGGSASTTGRFYYGKSRDPSVLCCAGTGTGTPRNLCCPSALLRKPALCLAVLSHPELSHVCFCRRGAG